MIEIIYPQGTIESPPSITFERIQELVAHGSGEKVGMVEVVTIPSPYKREPVERGATLQVCCNEDGMRLSLVPNQIATRRFMGAINMEAAGIRGVVVVLSGKDMLD